MAVADVMLLIIIYTAEFKRAQNRQRAKQRASVLFPCILIRIAFYDAKTDSLRRLCTRVSFSQRLRKELVARKRETVGGGSGELPGPRRTSVADGQTRAIRTCFARLTGVSNTSFACWTAANLLADAARSCSVDGGRSLSAVSLRFCKSMQTFHTISTTSRSRRAQKKRDDAE